MEEQKLIVPTPDHKKELSRPSLMRVYQYLANSNISLTYSPGTEFVRLTGVPLRYAANPAIYGRRMVQILHKLHISTLYSIC